MLPLRLKAYGAEILGTLTAGTGAVASWQVQFDWWFRQFGTAVAFVAGGLTVIAVLRKEFPLWLPVWLRKKE